MTVSLTPHRPQVQLAVAREGTQFRELLAARPDYLGTVPRAWPATSTRVPSRAAAPMGRTHP